jgi:hypothetical protein
MYWLVGFMVFNATFNNISIINIVAVGLIGGGHQSSRRKPPTCRKSLINTPTCRKSLINTLSHNVVHLAMSGIRTRNVSCIGPPLAETDIL